MVFKRIATRSPKLKLGENEKLLKIPASGASLGTLFVGEHGCGVLGDAFDRTG